MDYTIIEKNSSAGNALIYFRQRSTGILMLMTDEGILSVPSSSPRP